MMIRLQTRALPLLSLAAALALTACNNTPAADNTAMDTNAMAVNDMGNADDMAMTDDTPPPAIAAPVVASGVSSTEAAPVAEAAKAAAIIESDDTVTRVAQTDGWAWMQGGQIIRTASRDGHRVSYYRRGESDPYFVQQDGQGYSYRGGHVSHAFDRSGHPQQVDDTHRRQAEDLDRQSRTQHDHARDNASRHPRPTPTPTPQGHDEHGNGRDGGHGGPPDHNGHGPAPTPTPTPTPTATPTRDHHRGDSGHDGQSRPPADNDRR